MIESPTARAATIMVMDKTSLVLRRIYGVL